MDQLSIKFTVCLTPSGVLTLLRGDMVVDEVALSLNEWVHVSASPHGLVVSPGRTENGDQ